MIELKIPEKQKTEPFKYGIVVSPRAVDYVNRVCDSFLDSKDPEEHAIGVIYNGVLKRLKLRKNTPGSGSSQGANKK